MNTIKKWGKRVLIGIGILSFLLIALAVLVPSEPIEEVVQTPVTQILVTMTPVGVSPTYTPYPTREPLSTYTPYPTEVPPTLVPTVEPTATSMPLPTMAPTVEPTLRPTASLVEISGLSEQEWDVIQVVYDGISLLCITRDTTIDGFLSGDASLQHASFFGMGLAYGITIIDLENANLNGVGAEYLDMYNTMLTAMRDGYSLCELGIEITAQGVVAPFDTFSVWLDAIETVLCPMLKMEPLVWFE